MYRATEEGKVFFGDGQDVPKCGKAQRMANGGWDRCPLEGGHPGDCHTTAWVRQMEIDQATQSPKKTK